jgi:hypothetical protein
MALMCKADEEEKAVSMLDEAQRSALAPTAVCFQGQAMSSG